MSEALDLAAAAARLVADLMPIAVAVDGPGAEELAAALGEAGAAAEVFSAGAGGFDLAVLLAPVSPADMAGRVQALGTASERLLYVPVPLGTTEAPAVDAWFELFAEHGFQPVVEYDASFLGQGAFLVDREAVAAEEELASFAERVSLGGALQATTQRVAALEAELGDAGDRAALKNALADREAALAAREAALAAAEAEAEDLRQQVRAWERVGQWAYAELGRAERTGLAALRAARGRAPKKRRWFTPWRRRPGTPDAEEARLLAEGALVRGSRLFDPVWYVAMQPEVAARGLDPVWHYVLEGAAAGADPGPEFDNAAYRRATPECGPNALVDAIRSGAVQDKAK